MRQSLLPSSSDVSVHRVLLALAGWPIVFTAVAFLPRPAFTGALMLVAAIAAREVALLVPVRKALHVSECAVVAAGVVFIVAMTKGEVIMLLLVFSAVAGGRTIVISRSTVKDGISYLIAQTACIVYVGAPLGVLVQLRSASSGLFAVMTLLAAVWARDAGAYLTGQLYHGRPLVPLVSSNKTFMGAIGGAICSSLIVAAAGAIAIIHTSLIDTIFVALIIGVLGQSADLLESLLKRHASVRHSGALFGAQGGMLDTIDGFLLTVPAVTFWWLMRRVI